MGLFGLVFLAVALVLVGIGIGIAAGLVGCLLAAALVAHGVISSSLIVGIPAGRPVAGVRAFILQRGILAGIPAGSVCAWIGQAFCPD